ncbi:MAG: sulfatase-like hydrolase/transferase [Myxococcales bacterium]|nr:sulfatase-like hydrolase/transferase [Myxococcales bacterium]
MDRAVVAHYLSSLDSLTGPRFDYLVLDSTHYDYAYPPEYETHVPSGTLDVGIRDGLIENADIASRARGRAPLVKNRYLNAVGWVDAQLSDLVARIKAKQRWETTLVVIVGDHGEAFWEHGSFGHGMGLEEEQIRVASMFCGVGPLEAEIASHADVFPTWFAKMELSGVPGPFMTGRSLLERRPESEVAVSGMGVTGSFHSRRFVAVGSGLKLHFDNSARLPIVRATDLEDQPLHGVPEGAQRVLAQALATKLLRSPR